MGPDIWIEWRKTQYCVNKWQEKQVSRGYKKEKRLEKKWCEGLPTCRYTASKTVWNVTEKTQRFPEEWGVTGTDLHMFYHSGGALMHDAHREAWQKRANREKEDPRSSERASSAKPTRTEWETLMGFGVPARMDPLILALGPSAAPNRPSISPVRSLASAVRDPSLPSSTFALFPHSILTTGLWARTILGGGLRAEWCMRRTWCRTVASFEETCVRILYHLKQLPQQSSGS